MLLLLDIRDSTQRCLDDIKNLLLSNEEKIYYCINILNQIYDEKYIYYEFIRQLVYEIINPEDNPYKFNFVCDPKYIFILLKMKQPEQRSPEWFAFRSERLTASDLATALGDNPYCKPNELILKKCGIKKPFKMNSACLHGVKFEPVSCMLYEYLNKTKVYEFGCISHKYYNFLGASPDGICEDGTMLEIKNPTRRKIVGVPPKYYWVQMQLQMEVFDLYQCDFLENKCSEYLDYEDYLEDTETRPEFKGVLVEYFTSDDYKTAKFEYCPINYEDPLSWVKEQQDMFDALPNSMYSLNVVWWKIDVYSCTRIYRDLNWFSKVLPELASFWDMIVNYRRNGNFKELITVPKKRQKKCKLVEDELATNPHENTVSKNFLPELNSSGKCLIMD